MASKADTLPFREQLARGAWMDARWPLMPDVAEILFGRADVFDVHLPPGREDDGFGLVEGRTLTPASELFGRFWRADDGILWIGKGFPEGLHADVDLAGSLYVDDSYDGGPLTLENWRIRTTGNRFPYNKGASARAPVTLRRIDVAGEPGKGGAQGLVKLGTNDTLERSYLHHANSDFIKFVHGCENVTIRQNLGRYGGLGPGKPHFDAAQITGSGRNLVLDQNTFYAPARSSPHYEGGVGFVSAFRLYPERKEGDAEVRDVLVTRNLCIGFGQVFTIGTKGGLGRVDNALYDGNIMGALKTWAEFFYLAGEIRTGDRHVTNVEIRNTRLLDGGEPVDRRTGPVNGRYNMAN